MKKPIGLATIVWPVFKLANYSPVIDNGITYYVTNYITGDTTVEKTKIIDNQNFSCKTLGLRRLQIPSEQLYKISFAIYTLHDLLKLAKKQTWFIDNIGQVFQYKKSIRAKLVCYKIKKIHPINAIGCIIEVEGLLERFKSLRVPKTENYAGILEYNSQNLFYGICNERFDPTWRLV